MGIMHVFIASARIALHTSVDIDTSYYLICLSLNMLLTLMIIARLILHSRKIRHTTGTSDGLYSNIVTMLVESYALYAVTLLSYIVPLALANWAAAIFWGILGNVQVCATRPSY